MEIVTPCIPGCAAEGFNHRDDPLELNLSGDGVCPRPRGLAPHVRSGLPHLQPSAGRVPPPAQGSGRTSPSLKLSGVTFRIPITRGAACPPP